MESLGKLCLMLLVIFLSCSLDGFVLLKFYNWFVLNQFHAPVIVFKQMMVVGLFLKYLKPNSITDFDNKDEKSAKKLAELILGPIVSALFILLLGYIFSLSI